MGAPTALAAVRAVFDRAGERIPTSALPLLVMNDPGHAAYVAAYERVLSGGVPALFEEVADGSPLIGSFDITENLLLSHTRAGESAIHRWFSLMTACIELLGASAYRFAPFATTLATLLVDSFALADADVAEAPLDLLPRVCRELKASASTPHERWLALLGELFTATLSDAETDLVCHELSALHEKAQLWYAPDGSQNHFYAARSEFVWGAAVTRSDSGAERGGRRSL